MLQLQIIGNVILWAFAIIVCALVAAMVIVIVIALIRLIVDSFKKGDRSE